VNRINPKDRPNVIRLLNHKFISGVETFYKQIELEQGEKHKFKSQSPIRTTEKTEENMQTKNHDFRKESTFPSLQTIPITIEDYPLKSAPQKLNHDINEQQKIEPQSVYSFKINLPVHEVITNIRDNSNQGNNSLSPSININIQSLQESPIDKREETKMAHVFEATEKSEIESLNVIKNLTDGTATPTGDYVEINPRFPRQDRRNIDTKGRRPLGTSKRYPFKSGYTNLSEDESISGASFLFSGSPGTIPEMSEDRGHPSSNVKTPGSNRYLHVPNGRVFQFPDPNPNPQSQFEDSVHYEHKEWEVKKQDKIEEEDEKDDVESEQEKERNKLQKEESENEMKGSQGEEYLPEMKLFGSIKKRVEDVDKIDDFLSNTQNIMDLKDVVPIEIENGFKLNKSKMKKSSTFGGVLSNSDLKQEYRKQNSDLGSSRRYENNDNDDNIKERVFQMGEESNLAISQNKCMPNETGKVMKVQFVP